MRLAPSEREAIEKAARAAGKSASDWARYVLITRAGSQAAEV